jgi:hypothetical protein
VVLRGRSRVTHDPACSKVLEILEAASETQRGHELLRRVHGCSASDLARLTLDGVLEIESRAGFVSGFGARQFLPTIETGLTASDRIGQLSITALTHGHATTGGNVSRAARWLYRFNRHPLSPAWLASFPNRTSMTRWLAVSNRYAPRPPQDWTEHRQTARDRSWASWQRTDFVESDRETWKLYIAPSPSFTAVTLRAALGVVFTSCALAFKVAVGQRGVLRPDKMVAYFRSFDDLYEASVRLERVLAGVEAQPVPFTRGLTADGLLSMGVDPPSATSVRLRHAKSWRSWITHRLASYLVIARATGADAEGAVDFALRRIALAGIDPNTWAAVSPRWHDGTLEPS